MERQRTRETTNNLTERSRDQMIETIMAIPPGYYFLPSDQELITSYLLKKSTCMPLPSIDQISEKDLYCKNSDPWDVLSDVHWDCSVTREDKEFKHEKRVTYVFTRLSRINGKTRVSRGAGCGKWDGQTGGKNIYNESGRLIGVMKMFSFLAAKKGLQRDHWIMHEYSLAEISLDCELKYKDHVICRITRLCKVRIHDQPLSQQVVLSDKVLMHEKGLLDKKRSAAAMVEKEDEAYSCKMQKKETSSTETLLDFLDDDDIAWMLLAELTSAPLLDDDDDGYLQPNFPLKDNITWTYEP